MSQTKPNARSIVSTTIIVVVFAGLAAFLLLNRQRIIDTIAYLQYKPSAQMETFARRSSMNDEGKFLFYSASPSLQDKSEFNASCPNATATVAILGCYDGERIYIYNVTDSRIDGVRDVTAAYEMLHAAYKRLSDDDRKKVDSLVEVEFKNKGDSAMQEIIKLFATTEPGQRDNELFSLIATQIPSIDPQLEAIYARYFTNRQVLVALYNQYSSVFDSYTEKSEALSSQLVTLNASIKAESEQYNQDVAALNSDIEAFNAKAQGNSFSTQSEFNSQKAILTNRELTLKNQQVKINSDIATYNDLLSQYNALTTISKQLFNSINSLAPSPST